MSKPLARSGLRLGNISDVSACIEFVICYFGINRYISEILVPNSARGSSGMSSVSFSNLHGSHHHLALVLHHKRSLVSGRLENVTQDDWP